MSNFGRLVWADAARGICMILVVLVHVHHKYYLHLDWEVSLPIERIWSAVHLVLTPLRIPLFFAVSGMLAASAIAKQWRDVAFSRVAEPAYLYVLWITLAIAVYTVLGSSIDELYVRSVQDFLGVIFVPSSSLWYLYALPLYFVCAKALRSIPLPFVLVMAGLVSVGAYSFAGDGVPARLAQNLVFFLCACYMPDAVRRIGLRATPRTFVLALVSYSFVVCLYLLDLDVFVGVRTVAAFVAVWAGINVVALLCRISWFSGLLVYVGRNTLPIYVLHVPLLGVLAWFTSSFTGGQSLFLATVYPVLVAGVVIGVSLILRAICVQFRLGWLFSLRKRNRVGKKLIGKELG